MVDDILKDVSTDYDVFALVGAGWVGGYERRFTGEQVRTWVPSYVEWYLSGYSTTQLKELAEFLLEGEDDESYEELRKLFGLISRKQFKKARQYVDKGMSTYAWETLPPKFINWIATNAAKKERKPKK